jgi:hypothetical protein
MVTNNNDGVPVAHWSGADQECRFEMLMIDQREHGRAALEVRPRISGVPDGQSDNGALALSAFAEVSDLPGLPGHRPALHLHFPGGELALSVFPADDGSLVLRFERGVCTQSSFGPEGDSRLLLQAEAT